MEDSSIPIKGPEANKIRTTENGVKIGILSDTHLSEPHPEFKGIIETRLKEVDRIFHAGDIVDRSIIEYLSSLKELTAVCGNMDPPDIQRDLPKSCFQ